MAILSLEEINDRLNSPSLDDHERVELLIQKNKLFFFLSVLQITKLLLSYFGNINQEMILDPILGQMPL